MKYWTRNTHNFNNETNEWEFKEGFYDMSDWTFNSILGIHALDSGRWKTLEEICNENQRYYEQYKNEAYSGITEESKIGFSKEIVLNDLLLMEKLKLVTSKEI